MKKFSIKEIIVPAIMLFIIAAFCTALLAGTNLLTKDKIADIAVQTEMAAKVAVLPEAKSFSDEKTVSLDGAEIPYYEALDESDNVIGYVFSTATKSYGGDLSCMVGINCETNKITGVEITAISDTPGLGMKADSPDFLQQFIDRSGEIGVNKTTSTDTEIMAITGATITSKAVTNNVNTAFKAYETLKAGDNNG